MAKDDKIIDIGKLKHDKRNFNKGTKDGKEMIEKSFLEFGAGRSILLDKDDNIIAGNKSTSAAKKAGIKKVRIIETDGTELIAVKRTDVSIDSKEGREMALLDNRTNELDLLWEKDQLSSWTSEWNVDLEEFGFSFETEKGELSLVDELKEKMKKRTPWGKAKSYEEPLCDLKENVEIHSLRGFRYMHSFKTGSKEGIPISQLKTEENVPFFAIKAEELIRSVIGMNTPTNWAICTTPKRRHKEKNFAQMVCEKLACLLDVPFYEDAVEAKTRARIDPVFTLKKNIAEDNIILYDDILTGGTTLYTTANLFPSKNLLLIVSINNHR